MPLVSRTQPLSNNRGRAWEGVETQASWNLGESRHQRRDAARTAEEERTRRLKVTAKQGTSNKECLGVTTKKRAMMRFGRRKIRTRLLRQRRGIGVTNDSPYYHSSRSKSSKELLEGETKTSLRGQRGPLTRSRTALRSSTWKGKDDRRERSRIALRTHWRTLKSKDDRRQGQRQPSGLIRCYGCGEIGYCEAERAAACRRWRIDVETYRLTKEPHFQWRAGQVNGRFQRRQVTNLGADTS